MGRLGQGEAPTHRQIVLAASRDADGGGRGMEGVLMVHLGFSLIPPFLKPLPFRSLCD
jgi:hypothetical protein